MATTTPDNIQYPVNSDQVAPLASHFKNLADSTQAALVTKASATGLSDEITDRTDADTALQNQINDIKQTSRMYVKNGSTALTKGTPVYITGANGTNVIVGAASNASEATSSKTIGLLETDLAINAMGYVVTAGLCTNIDTSGAGAAGDPVWLGVDGAKIYGLINKPYAPAHLVYLGVVSKKNASTGEIEVRVQNGFELEELHNVQINSGTLATGQALTYDGSTQLWKNSTPASSLEDLSDVQITAPLLDRQVLQYDDSVNKFVNVISSGGVTVSSTAPDLATALEGDAWLNDNDGTLFVCLIDTDSTKLWMQVQANSALEGSILARLSQLEASAIAYGNPNPNVIINGGFDIWQRGTSFTVGTGYPYTADRWQVIRAGAVAGMTATRQPASLAGLQYALRCQRDSGNTNTAALTVWQSLESANSIPLANKTVTLSFYARAGANFSGTGLAASIASGTGTDQNLNIGGFTGYTVVATSTATLTTSWQRFTVSGTFGSSITQAGLLFQTVGVTGTAGSADYFEVTGVQLEVGNTATAFRRNANSIQGELAACQRYYYRSTGDSGVYTGHGTGLVSGYAGGIYSYYLIPLPVTMRVAPTSIDSSAFGTFSASDGVNVSTNTALPALSTNNSSRNNAFITATHGGLTSYRPSWFQANNTTSSYIGFVAEL